MATVTTNPDNTFTVTLVPREHKTLKRLGDENTPPKNKPQQLAIALTGVLASARNRFRGMDAPKLADKYNKAPESVQDQVDTLLGI